MSKLDQELNDQGSKGDPLANFSTNSTSNLHSPLENNGYGFQHKAAKERVREEQQEKKAKKKAKRCYFKTSVTPSSRREKAYTKFCRKYNLTPYKFVQIACDKLIADSEVVFPNDIGKLANSIEKGINQHPNLTNTVSEEADSALKVIRSILTQIYCSSFVKNIVEKKVNLTPSIIFCLIGSSVLLAPSHVESIGSTFFYFPWTSLSAALMLCVVGFLFYGLRPLHPAHSRLQMISKWGGLSMILVGILGVLVYYNEDIFISSYADTGKFCPILRQMIQRKQVVGNWDDFLARWCD